MKVDVKFSSEGKGEAYGTSKNSRSSVRAEMVKALKSLVQNAVKISYALPDERRTKDTVKFHTLVAPLIVNGELNAVKVTLREALNVPDGMPHKFNYVTSIEIGSDALIYGLKDDGINQNPLPTDQMPLKVSVKQLENSFNINVDKPILSRASNQKATFDKPQPSKLDSVYF